MGWLQLYAPTTLAPARDFWLMRYTSVLEDGSLVVSLDSLPFQDSWPISAAQLLPIIVNSCAPSYSYLCNQ